MRAGVKGGVGARSGGFWRTGRTGFFAARTQRGLSGTRVLSPRHDVTRRHQSLGRGTRRTSIVCTLSWSLRMGTSTEHVLSQTQPALTPCGGACTFGEIGVVSSSTTQRAHHCGLKVEENCHVEVRVRVCVRVAWKRRCGDDFLSSSANHRGRPPLREQSQHPRRWLAHAFLVWIRTWIRVDGLECRLEG